MAHPFACSGVHSRNLDLVLGDGYKPLATTELIALIYFNGNNIK